MEEPICKLCKHNKATKENSHILPFSLIREAVNHQATPKRDKEVVYTLSTDRAPSLFTGRSMLPDQIDEIKQIFDNVVSEEKNSTTEDYIFCPNCENRFSIIENYFSEQAISFLKSNKTLFANQDRLIPLKQNHNPSLIKLYVLSLFWRASISATYPHFSLNRADEELLRMILDECLDEKLDSVIEKVNIANRALIDSLPVIITYSEELDDPTSAINHVECFKADSYLLLTNRFGFLLFSGGKQNVDLNPYLYGINQFTQDDSFMLVEPKPVYVSKIFKKEWKAILSRLIEGFVKDFLHHKTEVFIKCYQMLFGKSPNYIYVERLKAKIALQGINVSDEQLIETIVNHFKELKEVQDLPS